MRLFGLLHRSVNKFPDLGLYLVLDDVYLVDSFDEAIRLPLVAIYPFYAEKLLLR